MYKLLLLSFCASTVVAVPPPPYDEAGKLKVSKSTLTLVQKEINLPNFNLKESKNNIIHRKIRDIEKLPPISKAAPLSPRGISGKHRVVFIMVEFADRKFPANRNKEYYRKLIFSKKGKSMRTFYRQNSYGKFDIEGEVYGLFTINEPVKNYHYKPGMPYGLAKMKKLIQQTLRLSHKKVNYKKYDRLDKYHSKKPDRVIDHFGIIYPGTYDDIWPHRWGGVTMGQVADVRVEGYFIQNTSSHLGTFIHEFGHDLGLPDLYDTDYSSYGIGKWGVMALGSWADGGKTPIQMCAWSKMQLGWLTPRIISRSKRSLNLKTSSKKPVAFKVPIGSIASKEYFLIENRQRLGYDKFLPDTGVLIWHVDETQSSNADEKRRLVDLVEAAPPDDLDGTYNQHKPRYTHTYKKGSLDSLSNKTNPSSRSRNGKKTGIAIKVLSRSAEAMRLKITRPRIAHPKGKLVEINYDNYKSGEVYYYFNFGKAHMRQAMTLMKPYSKAVLFSLRAGVYYTGNSINTAPVRFVVYQNRRGRPGRVLYKSKKIYPDLNSKNRFAFAEHFLKKKSGLKIKKSFFVALEADSPQLAITSMKPASGYSYYRNGRGAFKKRRHFSHVIRARAVARVKTLLATDRDRWVKNLKKANQLRDQKKFRKALKLYRRVIRAMTRDKYKYQEWLGVASNSYGVMAYQMGNYKHALIGFEVALKFANEVKEAGADRQQAIILENMGEVYFHMKNYDKAKSFISRSLDLKKKIKIEDDMMVDSLIWLGKTYKRLGAETEARSYLKQGLDLAESLKDDEHIAMARKELN